MPAGKQQRMEALYARIPHIDCKKLCRACCGPIMQAGTMTQLEFDRLSAYPEQPADPKDFMACSLLTHDGLCSVYDARPMICRLWGVVDDPMMRCPHGCEPVRWLTNEESRALLREATEIGGDLRPGLSAIEREMRGGQ